MNENKEIYVLSYLRNIDRNSLIYYFFIFMVAFFILKNVFEISNHVFFFTYYCVCYHLYLLSNK